MAHGTYTGLLFKIIYIYINTYPSKIIMNYFTTTIYCICINAHGPSWPTA